MRKLLAYIILLMHVNTYMFFPMVDETDVYTAKGVCKDDINSLVEYINQVLLGHRDNTPEDEDDDQAHYYHAKSMHRYYASVREIRPVVEDVIPTYVIKDHFAVWPDPRILYPVYDVSPPPPNGIMI